MDKTFKRVVYAVFVAALTFAALASGETARFVIAILVALPSLVLMLISRRQLGKSFSIGPKATALVTTGIYSKIQHPLYAFLDLLLVGIIIALNMPLLLLLWGGLVTAHILQARREENVLRAAFGAEYDAYRSSTWF